MKNKNQIKFNFQINFLKLNSNGELELKKTHDYYYQVQGQLHIAKKQYCYFVVYSENMIHFETIQRNNEFWENVMQHKLTRLVKYLGFNLYK